MVFNGRGFLQLSFGMIPRRHPIQTVVGAPVEVKKNPTPTAEEIDEVHKRFMQALEKLFEDHKHKYLKNAKNIILEIE